MSRFPLATVFFAVLSLVMLAACASDPQDDGDRGETTSRATAEMETASGSMSGQRHDAEVNLAAPITDIGASAMGVEATTRRSPEYDRIGWITYIMDGRLWVFAENSKESAGAASGVFPETNVSLVGEGPNGMTLRGMDSEALVAYRAVRPGFACFVDDGRLWVFREGSEDLRAFKESGIPEKCVTLIGEGPEGMSLRAPDRETADAYLAAQ